MGGVTTLTESKIRGRNDDGSETTATWIAAENTAWTQRAGVTFRVRFEVTSSAAGSGVIYNCQLQCQHNGGSWVNVTPSSSVVRAVNSANITDTEATTEQLAGSLAFLASEVSEDGITAQISQGLNQNLEVEFVIQIVGADVANGDEINLQTTKSGVAMDAYGVALNPLITVEKLPGGGNLPVLGVG